MKYDKIIEIIEAIGLYILPSIATAFIVWVLFS